MRMEPPGRWIRGRFLHWRQSGCQVALEPCRKSEGLPAEGGAGTAIPDDHTGQGHLLHDGKLRPDDAIRQIRRADPDARIVVLTMYQGDEDIFRALKSGAATYLLKDTPSDELVRAVREVHLGLSSLPANVAQRLATRPFDEGLTSRGMEVLRLLAAGMRNKEIAAALDISQETVQGHVKKILRTLEVNDRTAAVTVAIRRGIIRLD